MVIRVKTIGTMVGLFALAAFAFNVRDMYRWWKLSTM